MKRVEMFCVKCKRRPKCLKSCEKRDRAVLKEMGIGKEKLNEIRIRL